MLSKSNRSARGAAPLRTPPPFPRNLAPGFTHYLCDRGTNQQNQNKETIMKTRVTETRFRFVRASATRLISTAACLGVVILICSSASAQNLFVSGNAGPKNCSRGGCGVVYKFNWDGGQSIFAAGLA